VAAKILISFEEGSQKDLGEFFRALKESGFEIETPPAKIPAGRGGTAELAEANGLLGLLTRVFTETDPPLCDLAVLLDWVSGLAGCPVGVFWPDRERAVSSCKAASSAFPENWKKVQSPAGFHGSDFSDPAGLVPRSFPLDENDHSLGFLVASADPGSLGRGEEGLLETLARAIGRNRSRAERLRNLDRAASMLDSSVDTMVEGCVRLLEMRGSETGGHGDRVTALALKLGEKMGLSDSELVDLRRGALLHDIGKLALPDSLLQKTDSLTEDDWKIIRTHTTRAHEAFRSVRALEGALEVPLRHHERFDGSGYPGGVRGNAIPLAARIFAVVDVWDSLLSDRSYRRSWTPEKALEHLERGAGIQFDPQVVTAFASLLEEDPSLQRRPF
jgi:hypothetical protein